MATIKSYTDLEQSKKLAEILPIESADMKWFFWKEEIDAPKLPIFGCSKTAAEFYKNTEAVYLPCWSLAALLQVLPLGIYDELDGCDYELEIEMIDKMPRYIRLGDIYHSQFPYDFEKDTLLDNIVESIIWLNDNNYLEL